MTLREVYAHPGEHTVKLMIDPRESTQVDSVVVDVRNSDGLEMPFTYKRWGTKLTISFVTDFATPDGLCVIDLLLRRAKAGPIRERFSFWCIK